MLIQDTHTIFPGDVLKCKKGMNWICVGFTDNGHGNAYVFVRDVTGLRGTAHIKDNIWTKHMAMSQSFVDFFVNASAFLKGAAA